MGKLRFEDATTLSSDWTFVPSSANPQLTLAVTTGSPIIEIANRTATFSTILAGNQGFNKTGVGILAFSSTVNNLTGNIILSGGITRVKTATTFGTIPGGYIADLITLNGGILMNNDTELNIPPTQGITLGSLGGGLQAGWSRGIIIDSPIVGSGPLTNFTDTTPGVIVLNAVNTYTGPTFVSGWLQVNGSLDAASAVTVNSGGVLLGKGSVNGRLTVATGGNINPGGLFSIGTLTVNNSATLNSCTLQTDLSSNPSGPKDSLLINGDLTLTGTVTVARFLWTAP